MAYGIIILKKSDIGIILKQWDNIPCKNSISVALGILFPFDNDKISAKVMCNDCQHQDRITKTILFKYGAVGITFISYTWTLPSARWMENLDLSEKRTLFD
jgi:hypothetical protein